MNAAVNSTLAQCSAGTTERTYYIILGVVGILAILVLIILSFITKRENVFKDRCYGVPGIVVPLNLLSYNPHYIICLFIFGAISGDLFDHLRGRAPSFRFPVYNFFLQSFLNTVVGPVLLVLWLSFKYFPLFACLNACIPLVGHIIGFIYSIVCVMFTLYQQAFYIYCNLTGTQLGLEVAAKVPIFICYLIIIGWYLWRIIKEVGITIVYGCSEGMSRVKASTENYQYYKNYVKRHLFVNKTPKPLFEGWFYKRVLDPFLHYAFPGFFTVRRLPLTFLGAITIVYMFIYQTSFQSVGLALYGVVSLTNTIQRDEIRSFFQLFSDPNTTSSLYRGIVEFVTGEAVIIPASFILSLIFCSILLIHIIASVHKTLSNMAKGKFPIPNNAPYLRLAASWKFAGFQVAFVITAYAVYAVILLLLGQVVLIVYFFFKLFPSVIPYIATYILLPVIWFFVLLLGQLLLCKLLFVQRRDTQGRFFAISNKKIFQWISYYFFFYNAFVGLLSAIYRLLMATVLNLMLLIRVDRAVLPALQSLDTGYSTYLGFLYLDYAYNNAVVHVFIKLLVDSQAGKDSTSIGKLQDVPAIDLYECRGKESTPKDVDIGGNTLDVSLLTKETKKVESVYRNPGNHIPSSVRARNRWLVAYTLIRNPSLQSLTASQLQIGKETEKESEDIDDKTELSPV